MDTTSLNIDFNKKNCYFFKLNQIVDSFENCIIEQKEFYQLYLFKEAKGTLKIEFNQHKNLQNTLAIIFPNQTHKLVLHPNSNGYVILFSEEIFCTENLRKELRAYCINIENKLNFSALSQDEFSDFETLLLMIDKSMSQSNIFNNEQIRHVVKIILLKLLDKTKDKELNNKESVQANIFFEFSSAVDTHYKSEKLVTNYASMLGITAKKLNTISKKICGKTALQVIHERIYQEARRLLVFTDLTHKEIAYELNFDSPSAFNKFIHLKSEMTPTKLQNQLEQMYKSMD